MKAYIRYGITRLLRPWRGRIPTYFLVSSIILVNFVVILFYNANFVLNRTKRTSAHSYINFDDNSDNSKVIRALSAMLANVSGEVRDGKISVRVLAHVLDGFKDKDEAIQKSYVDKVLSSNSLTYDMGWPAICKNLTKSRKTGNALFGFKKFLTINGTKVSSDKEGIHSKGVETMQVSSEVKSSAPQEDGEGSKSGSGKPTLQGCWKNDSLLNGVLKPLMDEITPEILITLFTNVQKGGHYSPTNCAPKEKTAIIIPYRNRYSHLHILLLNLFPFLIRQGVDFTIFIIDQLLPGPFNRGMLLNVGFLEALKQSDFDCFIFHDVDLIPINDKNFYHCNDSPTHYVAGVDKFKYKLLYQNMFGGVVAFTKEQFKKVNGASNLYFGWGGEDDDLRHRVAGKGYKLVRKNNQLGLYDMIKHTRDESNQQNPVRRVLLKTADKRQNIEGLNTAIYHTLKVDMLPLYTWVSVSINATEILDTAPNYMNKEITKLRTAFKV